MINIWFNKDIGKILEEHRYVVISDKSGDGEFLLKFLPEEYRIFTVTDELSELEAKYLAETKYRNSKVVFYSKQQAEALTFLHEYVKTTGVVCLDDMEAYIKGKLFNETGKNTSIDKSKLMLAAKLSIGKNLKWWSSIAEGNSEPLNLDEWLLDFLHKPNETREEMDDNVWNVFRSELYKLLGRTPLDQPANILAQETVSIILSGLTKNNLNGLLKETYYRWADSTEKQSSLRFYIEGFNINDSINPLKAHIDHPFDSFDRKIIKMLSEALAKGDSITEYASYFNRRIKSKKARAFKADWLNSVDTICSFKTPDLHSINSYKAFVDYYITHYSKLDTAIRKLYVAWLNDEKTLRPFQEYYTNICKDILQKWFSMENEYIPSQKGIIEKALKDGGKTAVIVCDGLRLEIADCVVNGLNTNEIKIDKKTAFSELPSVTENGMSALFGCHEPISNAQHRFSILKNNCEDVEIMSLEKLNDATTSRKLVLNYGDIDQVGEKKQLGGLKDIDNYEYELRDKIVHLFRLGYQKVVLTADHGFVITGILDEADKEPRPDGTIKTLGERYVLCNTPLNNKHLIKREGKYFDSEYQYYAKTDKPFRTRGAYGYSHGGFTPQECIIPVYELSSDNIETALGVTIANKKDLKEIAGNYFSVKLKADGNKTDLFSQERKVKLILFSGNIIVNTSLYTLRPGDEICPEFEITSGLNKVVIADKDSGVQIDSCDIFRSASRDLDGLF